MQESATKRAGWYWTILYIIYGGAMVGLLFLLFLLRAGRIDSLRYVGWVLFATSAILGWLPILTFRRYGRVARGKNYMYTTALVTSGLYAIVRHPQYMASDFLAAAVMCISQHWAAYLTAVIAIAVNHVTMAKADRDLVGKFGEPYREYMSRVPQWNLLIGVSRWWRKRSV